MCRQPLVQRRGDIVTHHFAHFPITPNHPERKICSDTWAGKYDMSDWHIEWQEKLGLKNAEKVIIRNDEKHIADTIIGNLVIEFQHSPIDIEDFRARNEFYSSQGYKVVWIFDVIDEYHYDEIYFDEETQGYRWGRPRKPFKQMNLESEKAVIYFQFLDDEDNYSLERISKSYNDFKLFYTDSHFSTEEFINRVSSKQDGIFPMPKKEIIKAPNELPKCSSIKELWKDTYSGMYVINKHNGKVMLINGRNGKMYHENFQENGKIIGKYARFDAGKGYYRATKDDAYYIVWDAEKRIWQLDCYFIDNKQIEKKKMIEEKKRYLESVPNKIEGCLSIEEISKTNIQNLIIKNEFNGQYYYLDFINNGLSFNAYKHNNKTGETTNDTFNGDVWEFKGKKVWKIVLDSS